MRGGIQSAARRKSPRRNSHSLSSRESIVDAKSQPIASAQVLAHISSTRPRGSPRHTTSGFEATSDENGVWKLDRLPAELSRVNLPVKPARILRRKSSRTAIRRAEPAILVLPRRNRNQGIQAKGKPPRPRECRQGELSLSLLHVLFGYALQSSHYRLRGNSAAGSRQSFQFAGQRVHTGPLYATERRFREKV